MERIIPNVLTDAVQFLFIPDYMVVESVLQYTNAGGMTDFIYSFGDDGFDPGHKR
jgi:hypothetical protein